MDQMIKMKMVKEAEAYLRAAREYLEQLKLKVQTCTDPTEKDKLKNSLEQDQFRFSQMMADVVIFKAVNGIFTDPAEIRKLK